MFKEISEGRALDMEKKVRADCEGDTAAIQEELSMGFQGFAGGGSNTARPASSSSLAELLPSSAVSGLGAFRAAATVTNIEQLMKKHGSEEELVNSDAAQTAATAPAGGPAAAELRKGVQGGPKDIATYRSIAFTTLHRDFTKTIEIIQELSESSVHVIKESIVEKDKERTPQSIESIAIHTICFGPRSRSSNKSLRRKG